MSLHLVTGYAGAEHITSADMGSLYAGMYGDGDYVLQRGSQLSAEIISNNKVRINDGDLLIQGRHVRLAVDSYEELDIENGNQSMQRHDLIVATYSKDAITGVESCVFEVIKGTPAESNPTDPTVITGDILAGDTTHQMPIYRISIDELTIDAVTQLFVKTDDLITGMGNKVDKVTGKALSTNDYDTTTKTYVDSLKGAVSVDSDNEWYCSGTFRAPNIRASGGYLSCVNYEKTTQIGSQNADHCHYSTTAADNYFDKGVWTAENFYCGSTRKPVLHEGNTPYFHSYYGYSASFVDSDVFLKNTIYPALGRGYTLVFMSITGGGGKQYIVAKTDNHYGAIIQFGYAGATIKQMRLVDDTWS